jgi:hypothetical protein
LESPAGIAKITVTRGDAKSADAPHANQRLLNLPAGQEVELEIQRK